MGTRKALQAEHWTILHIFLGLVDDMAKTRSRTDRESVGSWLVLREAASGHCALYEARAAKALHYESRCL